MMSFKKSIILSNIDFFFLVHSAQISSPSWSLLSATKLERTSSSTKFFHFSVYSTHSKIITCYLICCGYCYLNFLICILFLQLECKWVWGIAENQTNFPVSFTYLTWYLAHNSTLNKWLLVWYFSLSYLLPLNMLGSGSSMFGWIWITK